MKQSKSASEISKTSQIPISSVYKKIKKLCDLRILHVDRIDIDDKDGKKITYYKSRIRSLELKLTNDGDTGLRIKTFVSYIDEDGRRSRTGLSSTLLTSDKDCLSV